MYNVCTALKSHMMTELIKNYIFFYWIRAFSNSWKIFSHDELVTIFVCWWRIFDHRDVWNISIQLQIEYYMNLTQRPNSSPTSRTCHHFKQLLSTSMRSEAPGLMWNRLRIIIGVLGKNRVERVLRDIFFSNFGCIERPVWTRDYHSKKYSQSEN